MAIPGAAAAAAAAKIIQQQREAERRAAEARKKQAEAAAKKAQPKPKPQVAKLEERPKQNVLGKKATSLAAGLKARAKQEPKAKTPEELGRREGKKLANAAADRAEKDLGKPLDQVNAHDANAALDKALAAEAKKHDVDAQELKSVTDGAKKGNEAFAKALGDEARKTLAARVGLKNQDLVLNDTAGHELGAATEAIAKKASGAEAVGAVARKAASPEPTPAERRQLAQKRITEAKDLPPDQQSEEIEKAVKSAPRADRAELLKKNQAQLDALSKKVVGDGDVTDGDRRAMEHLARTADAAGPEGAKVLGTSIAGQLPKETDTNTLSELRGITRDFAKASAKAGSSALLRAAGAEATHSKDKTQATYLYESAEGATRIAKKDFDDQQKKVDTLNGKLNNYLAAAGPSLSPADRQKMVERFKQRHASEYAELEDKAQSYGGFVRERGEVLRTTDPKDPQTAALRDAATHTNDSFDKYSQTKDGQSLVRAELKKEAHGEHSEILRGLDLDHRSKEFRQNVQAGVVQAVTGTAFGEARGGKFTATHELLQGIKNSPQLFGAAGAKSKAFAQIIDELDGMTQGKAPPTQADLTKLGDAIDSLGGKNSFQGLRALGSVLSVAKTAGNLQDFDSQSLQDKVSTINDALGLTAEGGSFVINAVGREGTTIAKAFGFAADASKLLGGLLGGVTAAVDFSQGHVVDGLLSAGAAAAALIEVPGANVVAAALTAAQFVKSVIDAGNEREDARNEFRDLLDRTSLKDLPDGLKDRLIGDAPDFTSFKRANALAKETGVSPRDMLDKLGALPASQRDWALDHPDELKNVLGKAEPVFANSPEAVFDWLMKQSPAQRSKFLETTQDFDNSTRSPEAQKDLKEYDDTYDHFLAQHRDEGAEQVYREARDRLSQGHLSEQQASALRAIETEAESAWRDPETSSLPKERQLDHLRLNSPTAYLDLLRRQGLLPPSRPYTGPH